MSKSSDQSAWVLYRCVPGSSPLSRHLESGVDPGNEAACTLHTRGPNREIGKQKSNRARLVPRKQNGRFPQDRPRKRVVLFLMMLLDEEERKTVNRTQWQRKWLQRREVMGAYHSVFMELAVEETLKFFEFIRMSYPKFLELVNLIGPSITR